MRAVVYCRVSTEDQALGLSLDWQRERCATEIRSRGWELVDVVTESASGKDVRRPLLRSLLARLRASEADVLMVARLDRLTRRTADFYALMDQAQREGWAIICLDPPVDMSHPFGRAMAGVAAIFAQLERDLIAQRQRDSVKARKAAGTYRNGPEWNPGDLERAEHLAKRGMSQRAIAAQLALEGRRAPGGGGWHARSVARALKRRQVPADT